MRDRVKISRKLSDFQDVNAEVQSVRFTITHTYVHTWFSALYTFAFGGRIRLYRDRRKVYLSALLRRDYPPLEIIDDGQRELSPCSP
ncbi:hypothetical protein PUN28_000777 [Cardiocondyla obscurior]|uniref:Uncharacterized protein n=1 Tax=Cardiocondyla obscurior TaxID=286306 RepID=A0AAW2H0X5_9HYME